MRTIHRYPLEGRNPRGFVLSLPADARILHVGVRPSDGATRHPIISHLLPHAGLRYNKG